tara:strand:- start:99 stop:389 length:291 start_codon:yes stop_codon:yes gene_type:complete
MSNEEIIELIKDAAFFGGTIKDEDVEGCKAFLDNLALTIPNIVVDLPNAKSKEFERWTQSKGYEPAFNGLWYEKNNQTYNTGLLHRAFTNEIEFGN